MERGLKMAIDTGMTNIALTRAKQQVLNVCTQGSLLTLVGSGTDKDEFGTFRNETTLVLKTFPVRFNPYDREVKEKITWADNTDIICYVPKLQFDTLSISIPILRKRFKNMRHDNRTYELRYIEPYSAFAGDFLYIIIGGKV